MTTTIRIEKARRCLWKNPPSFACYFPVLCADADNVGIQIRGWQAVVVACCLDVPLYPCSKEGQSENRPKGSAS